MKNTIIASIVAIICTAAICITCVCCFNSNKAEATKVYPKYMTEEEAAEYIGVDKELMTLLREDLSYFNGAYMKTAYKNADGEEVEFLVYSKDAIDEILSKNMKDSLHNNLNLKLIQEAKEKNTTAAAK